MRVRFWGVRGSVPYATSASIGHGCNTACVEVVDEETNRRLILDAGSGIVGVTADGAADVSILLTHYHWDHVQGLPFFSPLYRAGAAVTVWAPALGRQFVDIETMFESPFFPVPYDRLPSRPPIRMIAAGDLTINGFEVSIQPLNHPGGCFAYRIKGAQGDLVYATDHEFGNPAIDAALKRFASGASAVILDSHFTPDEMPHHKGWGHGDWGQCARFAGECGVGHLWLFHHKPGRPDNEMKEIEAAARQIFPATTAAKEGDWFLL
jgi:phosphoribosyl 1,2-cyclic phosphodiesterase